MTSDADQLRKIKDRYRALDGARWQLCCVDNRTFVEAKTRNGELIEIANFHPVATPDEIDFLVSAPDMVGVFAGACRPRNRSITHGASGPAKAVCFEGLRGGSCHEMRSGFLPDLSGRTARR